MFNTEILIDKIGQLAQLAISISWLRTYLVVIIVMILASWFIRLIKVIFFSNSASLSVHYIKPSLFSRLFWPLQFILLLLLLIDILAILIPTPVIVSPQLPLFKPLEISYKNPLLIRFDRPVKKKLQAKITPAVAGKWIYKNGDYPFFLVNELVFIPDESLVAQQEYLVEIKNIQSVLSFVGEGNSNSLFLIQTPPLPQVIKVNPEDKQINVANDVTIEIEFSRDFDKRVKWFFDLKPTVEFKVILSKDGSKAWIKPLNRLAANTEYILDIWRAPLIFSYRLQKVVKELPQEKVLQTSFTTAASPVIVSFKPNSSAALPNEPLEIEFKQPMDKLSVEKSLQISPSIKGKTSWLNDHYLIFTPSPSWSLDTTYKVMLSQSAKNIYGEFLRKDYIYQFSTIGEVKVVEVSPRDKATDVSIDSSIQIKFDQPVVQKEAESQFFIKPSVIGDISWHENTLKFTPKSQLGYKQLYQFGLTAGVKSLYGRDLSEDYRWSFTTEPEKFVLDIPLYQQHYMFTCFSAAAQMVLAYRGITNIDELGFMDEIGYQQIPREFVTNTWGDPNKGIVGTYDGSGDGGYGVHWDPVAKALSKYRKVEVKRQWNIAELLDEVRAGNPVLVWWVNGAWPAKEVSWNLPNGEKVYTVNGMHVEVVKGWIGKKSKPDYILTNDPWRGNRQYSVEKFKELWKWFDNTAVIVY